MRGKDIRQGNEKLVLRLIQREGLLSQSEAVELTGLKAPTILRIFTNLEEEGLILISDKAKDTGAGERKGRKPVYYRLNPDALYVVGLEFWAASATVVISNFVREPVYSETIEIEREIGGEAVTAKLIELIEGSIRRNKISRRRIAGIGIGAPGKVDIAEGTVLYYSRIPGLKDFALREYLEKSFDLPIFIHNNCSVIAMNEYSSGGTDQAENIMAVLIRGGVGGAYINNGKIITSGNITTMEIGHMSVMPGGRECSCGEAGCLETYLSEDSILSDLSFDGFSSIKELDDAISDGRLSAGAEAVFDEKAGILSAALRTLGHLFSPNLFLIISRGESLSRLLAEKAEAGLSGGSGCGENRKSRLKPACYDPLHAGMGACDIVFSNFFNGLIDR